MPPPTTTPAPSPSRGPSLVPFAIAVLVAAIAGFTFASFATYDSVQHLDREVHALHCSFIPGIAATDASGGSGCHAVLMSPYSSLFRTTVWGGIPIALAAMGTFAFLAWCALAIASRNRRGDRTDTLLLLGATVLPVLASIVMGTIAATKVGAFCKLCIGIYTSSFFALVFAIALHRRASANLPAAHNPALRMLSFALMLGAFVLVPIGAYAMLVPDHARFVGQCGRLEHPEDTSGVQVRLPSQPGAVAAVEVLDPLCPACRAFEQRLSASGLDARMQRSVVLFPLDKQCNWMLDETLHAGACTMSEAVLCAGDQGPDVLEWALREQDTLRETAARDPGALASTITARFPRVAGCLGSTAVRAKLNRSLRWVVANHLAVLTPQLYVNGTRLCDADTDLGLEFMLTRLLDRTGTGTSAGTGTSTGPGNATTGNPGITITPSTTGTEGRAR